MIVPFKRQRNVWHVRFGSKADMRSALADVCFVPEADIRRTWIGVASADQFNLTQPPLLRKERFERAVEAKESSPGGDQAIAYAGGEPYFSSAIIAFCSSVRIRCAEPTLTMVGSR